MLTVGSTFAGIGGLDLGLHQAGGFRTSWYSEVHPAALRVLAARFPDARYVGSVLDLFAGLFGGPDLVDVAAGGPPCQNISHGAGATRLGLAGAKSGLFYPWARAVGELAPRWFVMEQVIGLLTVNGGRDYTTVLDTMRGLGYDVAVVAHNSRAYVPQVRGRIYLVGCRAAGAAARALLPLRADGACDPDQYSAARWRAAGCSQDGARCYRKSRSPGDSTGPESWVGSDYAPTLIETETGKRAGALVVDDRGVRVLTPVEWERCHGFPDGWTEPAGGDVARWERLGNAVSPPVAWRIGQGIMEAEGIAA